MKKLLFACVLALAPFSLASADLKIAVIDLSKAFDNYYKTKDALQRIQAKEDAFSKDYQDMVADYQQMGQEAQRLQDASKDPTLSPAAQQDKAKALDQKKQDLLNLERKIEETKTERTREIQDEIMRRKKELSDEITKVINDYAAPQGYDLVVDRTSISASGAPIVLFASAKLIDITNDIITKLNADAPPAGSTAAAPAGAAGSTPAH
jgi:outer membrane protein